VPATVLLIKIAHSSTFLASLRNLGWGKLLISGVARCAAYRLATSMTDWELLPIEMVLALHQERVLGSVRRVLDGAEHPTRRGFGWPTLQFPAI